MRLVSILAESSESETCLSPPSPISSPGSGKTTLLQATAQAWPYAGRLAVLVGDIATDRDAERLAPYMPVKQLTTGGACHLELSLIQKGLNALNLEGIEYLFIENIGNLVCPASHDLGEHLRVVVLSVTEGDDKPAKYPKAFRTSQACVVSKLDLQPHVPFDLSRAIADAHTVQPYLPVFPVCALTGAGIEEWCAYLQTQREATLLANANP
ncbi:MAG: hydrogenase accessory protein HypB [Planctomycetales bacterium 12-60-4]|nr:MAG: hydrogenase accessory protein HypB [Planctomycetales bacterium 12-60-4]